ncbi:MAG TPA: hypothetical protein VFS05_15770 [Gemmatimonadaceae bacterium]|nr:hypothetical protein [Gemmatimonadaceae bacterium]
MPHRQTQHHGRSEGDEREIPGRDVEGSTEVRSETIAKAEEAREISRLVDENEGYDRQDHRDPQHGASRGRKTR